MVLYRLLSCMRPDEYCLISREDYESLDGARSRASSGGLSLKLPATYYRLPDEFEFNRPTRYGGKQVRQLVNLPLRVFQRARNIARLLRGKGCTAILACSGDPFDLPAAYVASKMLRIPFYAYLFDDYLYQWTEAASRSLARRAEPMLIKGARGVIVPNEFLRDEYRKRYNVEPTIVRNPYEPDEEAARTADPWPARAGEIRIVYTGAIYHAQRDAFQNLIKAIRLLDRPEVKLHIYTAQSHAELEQAGISGPVEFHAHVDSSEARKVQRRADILFLPLAFASAIPEVIRTSAPGKMGEYLASGRPLLAHVPKDSFVSWYIKEHGCGVVAGEPEPASLAEAVNRIISDESLRRTITENARVAAAKDFSLAEVRARFFSLF